MPETTPYAPTVSRGWALPVHATMKWGDEELHDAELMIRAVHHCDGDAGVCARECYAVIGISGYDPDDLTDRVEEAIRVGVTGVIPLGDLPDVITALQRVAATPSRAEFDELRVKYPNLYGRPELPETD